MRQIQTLRLTLGEIRDCDFDDMMSVLKNEVVAATYKIPDLDTREAELELFEYMRGISQREDRYLFGIFLDGKLIGLINDCEINGECIEMGYALHPDYHNQGYTTEAFSAAIKSLFSKGFNEIIAGSFEDNIASMRVMEKCGMKRTKMTAEIEYREKTHKCVYYSIKK